ncbi:MAG: DUF4388 domain-containing protein [Planctomycetota bacterium]
MTLKGKLEHFGLGELFQTLALNQHTGTLILSRTDQVKKIYFSTGSIKLLSSGKSMRIGEILVRAGHVSREQLDSVCKDQATSGKLLGVLLIETGAVTAEQVQAALRTKIEEELYDLFLWPDGDFEFLSETCAADFKDPLQRLTQVNIDPSTIIMEGLRQIDELRLIRTVIPDPRLVVRRVVAQLPPQFEFTPEERAIWDSIPEQSPVSSLLANSPAARFHTMKAIAIFLQNGWLEPLDTQGHLELARAERRKGSSELAADIYQFLHATNEQKARDPEFLKEAGLYLADVGDKESAELILTEALTHYSQQRNDAGTWIVGNRLLELDRPALKVLRTLWHARGAGNKKSVAKLESLYLAQLFEQKQHAEIESLLAELEPTRGREPDFWVQRAEAQRLLGDLQLALEYYERGAGLLRGDKNIAERVRVLRLIYDLDNSRTDIARQLQELLKLQARNEARKRRRFTFVGIASILALVAVIYPIQYEMSARKLFENARLLEVAYALDVSTLPIDSTNLEATLSKELLQSIRQESLGSVLDQYHELVNSYPFAVVTKRARGALKRLDRIAELKVRDVERAQAEHARLEELHRAQRQERVARLTTEAQQAEASGDYATQRARLLELLKSYGQSLETKIQLPLFITSQPPGAEVSIDGNPIGTTPHYYRHAPGTRFQVQLSRRGCGDFQHEQTDDGPAVLAVNLDRVPITETRFPVIDALALALSDRLLVPCRDGFLYAVSNELPLKQEALWRRRVGVEGHPAARVELIGGDVLVTSYAGTVERIQIDNGGRVWGRESNAAYDCAAAINADETLVAVGDTGGMVQLLEASRGTVIATRDLQFPVQLLAFVDDRLVVITHGRQRLELSLPELDELAHTASKARAVAFGRDGQLLLENGTVVDSKSQSSGPAPVTRVALRGGELCYGAVGGQWIVAGPQRRLVGRIAADPSCPPFSAGGFVYVGGVDGRLYCSQEVGDVIWSIDLGGTICDVLAASDHDLIVLLASGRIVVLEGEVKP